MKEKKWKKGDWCFYQFTLMQVKRTAMDHMSLSDGSIEYAEAEKKECFPLDLAIVSLSKRFLGIYRNIKSFKIKSMDMAKVHALLVAYWNQACRNEFTKRSRSQKNATLSDLMKEIYQFEHDLERACNLVEGIEVCGIHPFI